MPCGTVGHVRSSAPLILSRSIAYLWASPTTLVGLLLVGLAVATRGRAARVAGVIEAHGGWVSALLEKLPVRGGVEALTLGHVILGRSAAGLERLRSHERVHVRQAERWGPIFVPAYVCASLWARARGGDSYRDNPFEREASESPADFAGSGGPATAAPSPRPSRSGRRA
jgi:hypothetical protein